tara:strand:+ start:347 stop:577 length:231 start_codon:yes stop_codon:yes gene_type:complete
MKSRLTVLMVMIVTLTSCGVGTSNNVNFDGNDMSYFKDGRTNLCFGVVASKKALSVETTGLGVTCVPCENVEHLIE